MDKGDLSVRVAIMTLGSAARWRASERASNEADTARALSNLEPVGCVEKKNLNNARACNGGIGHFGESVLLGGLCCGVDDDRGRESLGSDETSDEDWRRPSDM